MTAKMNATSFSGRYEATIYPEEKRTDRVVFPVVLALVA